MKNNTFLLFNVLDICQIIDGQRSKMGITNILYGKKNHQTWSDVHLFQLYKYYRFLFKEDEDIIQYAFQELHTLGYIYEMETDIYKVTEAGVGFINNNQHFNQNNYRDGRILPTMEDYWSFMHLLVQTLSNLHYKNKSFLPIIRNAEIQAEVKRWIGKNGVLNGSKGLVHELTCIFEALPETYRILLVLRLSGNHRIGLTLAQLSKMNNITYLETKWQWESCISQIYYILKTMEPQYLPHVPKQNDLLISQSCKETWSLLQNNMTIVEISKKRKLKEATVMDHIIELALIGIYFDHSKYISDNDINKVEELYHLFGSKRLKVYKEKLSQLSYFQIRLALTLLDRGKSNENETIFK